MKKIVFGFAIALMTFGGSIPVFAFNDPNLILKTVVYPRVKIPVINGSVVVSASLNEFSFTDVNLRAGFYRESANVDFKGCVLYLEGLGDSVVNHIPLYKALSAEGYRTIFFDYFGQGGSKSSMNFTQIINPAFPALQISDQAKFIWNYFSKEENNVNSRHCGDRINSTGEDRKVSNKRVIGWSTGGLATYGLAHEGWADAVVLIAPGIVPEKFVGEAAPDEKHLLLFDLSPIITLRTLTTATYLNGEANPHIDPIKPDTPTIVPFFASNLLASAGVSWLWSISSDVKGMVFLSGPSDTYVNAKDTETVLGLKASHFSIVKYDKALHEIDNETPEIASGFRAKVVDFFNAN